MSNVIYRGNMDKEMLLVDMGDGSFSQRVEAHPPLKLMTDSNSQYSRIRVDVGQTGFFAGREARTLYEFSIASGASEVIKVVSPVNTVLQNLGVEIDLAEIRMELLTGGTEGGTFNTPLPIFKTNTMTTQSGYTPQITMNRGGTHTGGTLVDLLIAVSGANANKAISTGASEDNPQGFAPGTFYIKLTNTDGNTATGIFRARWEERP